MNIELGIGIGGSTLFAPTSNDQLVAYAWASAVSPSVTTSAVIHKTINAVPANSGASVLPPTVSSAGNATVSSVTANANGSALIPSVVIAGSISINAVIASGNSDSMIPIVSTIRNVSVSGIVANSTASAGVPTITIGGAAIYYLQFDGIDDKITVPHSSVFDLTTGWTIELNILIPTGAPTSGNRDLISKNDGTFAMNFGGGTTNFRPQVSFKNATGGTWSSTLSANPLAYDTKHTLTGVYDGTKLWLYVNGVLDASANAGGTPILNTNAVTIATYATRFFKGNIYSTRIYNRGLTATEVLDNKNGTVTRTGLIAEWLMSDGSGTTVSDSAGANHGTLTGGTWVVA